MVSTNQSGGSSSTARNEAYQMLQVDMNLSPLIRGIEDTDRALMYWNAVNDLGIDGEVREQILDRMQHLNSRES